MIFEKIRQFQNLILLLVFILFLVWLDPIVYFVKKSHERAEILNKIRIEQAETERQIALIKARTEAELAEIRDK